MRMIHDLPTKEVLLRWCGSLAVVFAIIGGLLCMHIVAGGSLAAPQLGMESPAASSLVMPDGDHVADAVVTHSAAHRPTPVNASFNCPATEHTADMSVLGGCTPAVGSTALSVPLPGTLTHLGPSAAFLLEPKHKAEDRALDPPSLEQLSISRT